VLQLNLCYLCVHNEDRVLTERVGIREFREKLSGYLESTTPVAITRHGETIGFYVPARRRLNEEDLEALRRAGERLSSLLAAAGAHEDELVSEFKALRKGREQER
jgi:antitoxin (DNA-binding transcriptional repressor) of toxin-antitoxin stability system